MPNSAAIKNNSFPNFDFGKKMPPGTNFINPEAVIKELGIKSGMSVADFGCGTGYFSLPLARALGSEGVVYAIDVLESKLESVKSQARISGINNIVFQRANLENSGGSKIRKESLDWVILVNMLFQNNNEGKKKIIEEAKRVLKKGGLILVIEWNESNFSFGPEKVLRISQPEMVKIAHEHGLGVIKEVKIGGFHYGVVLSK